MYDYGEGVIEDDTQAVYWYRKAADLHKLFTMLANFIKYS